MYRTSGGASLVSNVERPRDSMQGAAIDTVQSEKCTLEIYTMVAQSLWFNIGSYFLAKHIL